MKATLEFDLNDPDERREHSMAVNGRKVYMALSDVLEEFRKVLKYPNGIEEFSLSNEQDEILVLAAFAKARDILVDSMKGRDVNLDDLY